MTTLKQVSVETGIAIKDLIESKTATGAQDHLMVKNQLVVAVVNILQDLILKKELMN